MRWGYCDRKERQGTCVVLTRQSPDRETFEERGRSDGPREGYRSPETSSRGKSPLRRG